MKVSRFLLFVSILMLIVSISCSTDQDIIPDSNQNITLPKIGDDAESIPQWIYEEMSFFYYWNEELPESEPIGDEDPRNYFYSLLNSNDYFSFITDDAESIKEENSGTIMAGGFSTTFGVFTNSDNLFAIVQYVYSGSPADKAGLKRGDIILQVNGDDLNLSNLYQLDSDDLSSVTLGEYNGSSISMTDDIITLSTGSIELNPVIHYEVKEIDDFKVGYLVYVDFILGDDDKWLNSLLDALDYMKSEGISEFVLDLRYNPGGRVKAAEYLASALAPASVVANEEVLATYEYNDNLQEFFSSRNGMEASYFESRFTPNEHNLNLDEIYILTTGNTASASELVINSLKPYMKVTMIGEPTFGKFYGAYLLYDENDPPKHDWAITPVAFKYANASGETDFINGLIPDIYLEDNLLEARAFGDESDPMLSAAINLIKGEVISNGRISSDRPYEPVYDLQKINRKNALFFLPRLDQVPDNW